MLVSVESHSPACWSISSFSSVALKPKRYRFLFDCDSTRLENKQLRILTPSWNRTESNGINNTWAISLSRQEKYNLGKTLRPCHCFVKRSNVETMNVLRYKICYTNVFIGISVKTFLIYNMCAHSLTPTNTLHLHQLPKHPHRMESTKEASSNRPARGAKARAVVARVDELMRGGRKQARVRARKTKQLRRTSNKELKVVLANVCTGTMFLT